MGLHKLEIKTAEDVYNCHNIYQNEAIQHTPGSSLKFYFITHSLGKILGFDKNGHSVFISSFGKCDFGDLLKGMKLSDLYLFNLVNTYGMLEMTRYSLCQSINTQKY